MCVKIRITEFRQINKREPTLWAHDFVQPKVGKKCCGILIWVWVHFFFNLKQIIRLWIVDYL